MRYEISAREVRLELTDAPQTTGTTSGLRSREIVPVKATITIHSEGARVMLRGPQVTRTGLSSVWYDVKVSVDADDDMYVGAPQWVLDLVAEVTS